MKTLTKWTISLIILVLVATVTTFVWIRFDDVKKVVAGPVYSQDEYDQKEVSSNPDTDDQPTPEIVVYDIANIDRQIMLNSYYKAFFKTKDDKLLYADFAESIFIESEETFDFSKHVQIFGGTNGYGVMYQTDTFAKLYWINTETKTFELKIEINDSIEDFNFEKWLDDNNSVALVRGKKDNVEFYGVLKDTGLTILEQGFVSYEPVDDNNEFYIINFSEDGVYTKTLYRYEDGDVVLVSRFGGILAENQFEYNGEQYVLKLMAVEGDMVELRVYRNNEEFIRADDGQFSIYINATAFTINIDDSLQTEGSGNITVSYSFEGGEVDKVLYLNINEPELRWVI